MKKLGFEQQGSSTYLVYELGPEDASAREPEAK